MLTLTVLRTSNSNLPVINSTEIDRKVTNIKQNFVPHTKYNEETLKDNKSPTEGSVSVDGSKCVTLEEEDTKFSCTNCGRYVGGQNGGTEE